jgi:hypothetical protein
MTTITFSFLEYASGAELLDLLRRSAKHSKKQAVIDRPLSLYLDQIAIALGFNNWSRLHKKLEPMGWWNSSDINSLVLKLPQIGAYVSAKAVKKIVLEEAIETMESWARSKYTPLIEFAYRDNESSTGYGWPDVDMAEELKEEFLGQFPEDLIEKVGNDLDVDEGPWGIEDYGPD